jgi:S1-C subfamily serine protease
MPEHHGAQSLDAKQVFLAVAPSVYLVVAGRTTEAISRREGVLGSAVAISVDHAITNCHVVQNQPVITVIDEARSYVLRATVVRAHQSTDRCFIRVDGRLQPISGVRRARDVAIGERVYTIGNPSGLTRTLGEGLISGLRRLDGVTYIQTTAQVSPGSSGGALVDERGSLLGITTFLLKDGQNLNFAIAAEEYWR